MLWLAAFLPDRQQRVRLNSRYSTPSNMTSGVKQGSILGPLLLTLYINNLPADCAYCIIKLFTDDVKLLRRISSAIDRLSLHATLEKLCDWARLNGIGLCIKNVGISDGLKESRHSLSTQFWELGPMWFYSWFEC